MVAVHKIQSCFMIRVVEFLHTTAVTLHCVLMKEDKNTFAVQVGPSVFAEMSAIRQELCPVLHHSCHMSSACTITVCNWTGYSTIYRYSICTLSSLWNNRARTSHETLHLACVSHTNTRCSNGVRTHITNVVTETTQSQRWTLQERPNEWITQGPRWEIDSNYGRIK
jgi:hypothetical protein